MNMFYLTFVNGNIVLKYPKELKRKPSVITSVLDYMCLILGMALEAHVEPDALHVSCSSSMDFPKEYTKKKSNIVLADRLRAEDIGKYMWAEIDKLPSGKKLSKKQRLQLKIVNKYCEKCAASAQDDLTRWNGRLGKVADKLTPK